MLFGSTLPPGTIPGSSLFRQHLYEIRAGHMVWPSVSGPVPAQWPSLPAGVAGFYTVYPNPDELLAGKLDARIRGFIAGAHPGSMLTAYAEADGDVQHGGQFAVLGLTKDKVLKVHRHMHQLCRGSQVRYGPVVCGPGMNQVSFCPPGMDFYGFDWYAQGTGGKLDGFNEWRRNTGLIQKDPVLAVAETNSHFPAQRPYWFSAVFGWLKGYELATGGRAACFSMYWNPGGKLSGPWLPNDTATVDALAAIAAAA